MCKHHSRLRDMLVNKQKNLCSLEAYVLATLKVIYYAGINGIKYVDF